MTLPRLFFLLPALPALLSACASAGANGGASCAPGPYTLLPTQHVCIGGRGTLSYDSFSYSRCPPGMQCVWAGELVYRFTLATPKVTESFSLGPARPVYVSQALNGARIALDPSRLPATPQPGAVAPQQSVTLSVSRP
jgi:hypothetical protein